MKKLFTLLMLLLCVGGGKMWADEAVISWYLGTNGTAATTANSITGASGSAAVGFTIAITGNNEKTWSNGNGDITYNATTYKTLKNSNGAQNTITCPTGKVATQVVFYVVANADSDGKLSEIDGTSCDNAVTSHKDYENPTVITKSIDNKNSFTFTFSTKQVCFLAVVTYTDAASDVVADPQFSQTGNNVTLTCGTTGAKIYYTTDGSEPTTSSTLYSSAITLDNSCTIRAKAFNGPSNEYSSDIVKRECYANHSSVSKYITSLGYNGGTVSGDVWTGANFTITNNVENRGINYVNLAGSQDGFKLNHTDSYTIQPSEGIKVTKLVVVGKTWLTGSAGNASTIAFDDWTPASGTFFDYPTDGETYVKTIEFTPSTEQTYGQAITMRPGTNQLGAYIEVYGDIKTYAVTYAAGANGSGSIAAGEKKYGQDFTLSSSKFTRDGFEQTGWATYDGGPQVYALGGSYTTNAAITLYPVWSKIVANVVNSWDFTNWSDATKTDVLANSEKWNQYEKAGNGGTNFGDNGRSNVSALSNNTLTSTAIISEANGLKFTAPTFGIGLMFDLPSATISGKNYTYSGSQYIWLYSSTSTIKIPSVPANAVIEIGVESHNGGDNRGVTLKNGSTTLTQTQGEATSKTYQVCKWTNTSTAGDVVVTPSKGLHIYYITVTEYTETIPVSTKADRNFASFISTKKLDFSAAEGITAYIATGLNGASDAVVLQSVDVVPVGEPVIVKTNTQGATVNVPVTTDDASDVSGNNLVAGDGTTAWNGTAGYTYYYLANDLFHEANDGTLQSGKAYLKVANGGGARQLSIVFGDDETTGIADVRGKMEDVRGNFYDLSGRKVAQPTKGLYIVNGKKVVIK